ncbi:hypothetical protein K933_07938 [Candidatus Halobonum tyrrellensis G22]|uniref:Uncharacterized protein n=1 Tax=Candidatus Halobonum tyrrellensis G22 TaxID=1324957 RepID=V4HL27_9EURY|nr:hypothetical protein K933_07938 [Candidatus Halobonum tyrrellensis G22]
MTLSDRFRRVLRQQARKVGREYARSKEAYEEGRDAGERGVGEGDPAAFDLPTDDEGRARVVCRRHVDRRAVLVDPEGRPACFEAGHPDCEGCAEDVREGAVQTW